MSKICEKKLSSFEERGYTTLVRHPNLVVAFTCQFCDRRAPLKDSEQRKGESMTAVVKQLRLVCCSCVLVFVFNNLVPTMLNNKRNHNFFCITDYHLLKNDYIFFLSYNN